MGRRALNKADKQQRIRQAARELFESQGFEKTTTAEISERAGVGTGTLYLYVASKEQLLFDVFAEDIGSVWNTALERVDSEGPLRDELLSIFGSVSEYHARQPNIAATYFLELNSAVSSLGGVDAILRAIFDGLEQVLTVAQRQGRLTTDIDAGVLAHNLFAIWNFVMVWRYSHDEATNDAARVKFERSLDVALAGLLP